MRFRTFALALALACGLTTMGQARQKTVVNRTAAARSKRARKNLAKRVRPHKTKRVAKRPVRPRPA